MKLDGRTHSIIFLSGLLYFFLGYYSNRSNWALLLPAVALLFTGYWYLVTAKTSSLFKPDHKLFNDYPILWMAIAFRAIFLFSMPTLSDDYYRFIWDGWLSVNGINTFLYIPSEVSAVGDYVVKGFTYDWLSKLNSPAYYSVYPSVAQYVFSFSAYVGGGNIFASVLTLRAIILLAEIGIIILLPRLLYSLNISRKASLIYAFNPLVIIELTGNLHLESVMLFFVLLALYQLQKGKWIISGVAMAFAISTKLIPLIFLPALIPLMGFQKAIKYFAVIGLGCLLLFYPFYTSTLFTHFMSSLELYFQHFEFNASIYYIIREVGYLITGYNQIGIIAPALSILTFLTILYISLRGRSIRMKHFLMRLLLIVTFYFLLATVVHPWYLSSVVLLAVFFNGNRYAIIWSGVAYLSYVTYKDTTYTEQLWLTFLAYLPVYYFLIKDVFIDRKLKPRSTKKLVRGLDLA